MCLVKIIGFKRSRKGEFTGTWVAYTSVTAWINVGNTQHNFFEGKCR